MAWLYLRLPNTGPLFDKYGTGGWVSAYYRWKEKMEPRVIAWHKAKRDKHQAALNQLDFREEIWNQVHRREDLVTDYAGQLARIQPSPEYEARLDGYLMDACDRR